MALLLGFSLLQWRKSMMLEAQTKLLADVQLVVDAPSHIQEALDVQVRWLTD